MEPTSSMAEGAIAKGNAAFPASTISKSRSSYKPVCYDFQRFDLWSKLMVDPSTTMYLQQPDLVPVI
ncbi:hypothetical protein C5167_015250, partial [Papaver somniferum]